MDTIFQDDHPLKAAIEKVEAKGDFNAKDPRHEGYICEYFNLSLNMWEDVYNCDDYKDYFEETQDYLDLYAEYYGCELEICGMTAGGAEQIAATTAPLFLTLFLWLFK
ncbi:Oidioi.mRNA.OKI2018_I69.chr2.g7979.t1.cds [Oikopleura dioica]|uniref:Oidioi.mRNA.OKI2018_I69.chr2.g7979.t1.cds n=1 Tax=Oikopleura dioica TaxID=34765 RepID=A0ABN7T8W4_OIKDI|nr:Oidioi.mRNA.OKI2018_I69.chr2.g7979.t1.cds [Oikopleura dioica]